MTKFSSREDGGYDAILGELLRWKRQADNTRASKSQVAQGNSNDGFFSDSKS